jgi:hypothetical protein
MGKLYSDFLVARPSFCEGMARILDFGNTLNEYNSSPSGEIADEIAIRMDWMMVGKDLRNAMKTVAEEELVKSGS